jgi:hypothetical protein
MGCSALADIKAQMPESATHLAQEPAQSAVSTNIVGYSGVAERHPEASVIVPPRLTAVPSDTAETAPAQRDRHLQLIADKGRMGWQ